MHIFIDVTQMYQISDQEKGYVTKLTIEYCKSNICLREYLFQHFGFRSNFEQSNWYSYCQDVFQDDQYEFKI